MSTPSEPAPPPVSDDMQTDYFGTQEAAKAHAATHQNGFSIRRVNLEDAFLNLTGKRVQ